MTTNTSMDLGDYRWEPQPAAAQLISSILDDFSRRSSRLTTFHERLAARTGTQLTDWIDYLVLPTDHPLLAGLTSAGFYQERSFEEGVATWVHAVRTFPRIRVKDNLCEVALRSRSVCG